MRAEVVAASKPQGRAVPSASAAKGVSANKRMRRSKRANAGSKPLSDDFVVPVYHI